MELQDMIKRISTDNAPKAIGPYSQATRVKDLVYTSGQIAINPNTGSLIVDDFEREVIQILNNLSAILEASGSSSDDIIKLTVFLTDISQFKVVNKVFLDYFKDNYPSRSLIEVSGLPMGANIEIEAIGKLK